jgi:hypothetical protein
VLTPWRLSCLPVQGLPGRALIRALSGMFYFCSHIDSGKPPQSQEIKKGIYSS